MSEVHALTEKAMVMNLTVGMWQGYRLDKEASRKVTEEAGAKADAARVNKHLVPKDALAPVVTAASALRHHFYENTLPWRDNGDRLMTRKLYMKFIEEHERLRTEFDDAVQIFLQVDYPRAIEQAAFRMGDLFNPDDYPHAGELRFKFYARLDIDALTTANDFRVAIDQEHVDRVRASMEQAAEQRLQQAMGDVWKRIGDAIGRFHDRMSNPDAKFQASTVDNVQDLIDLVPGLNVTDDPDIEAVRRMIKDKLGGADAVEIRKDPEHRAELADGAKEILDRMSGFIRAFGGNVQEAA